MDVHEDAPVRCVHGVALDGDCAHCDVMNGNKRALPAASALKITYNEVLASCYSGLETHVIDNWPEGEECTMHAVRGVIKDALDAFLTGYVPPRARLFPRRPQPDADPDLCLDCGQSLADTPGASGICAAAHEETQS